MKPTTADIADISSTVKSIAVGGMGIGGFLILLGGIMALVNIGSLACFRYILLMLVGVGILWLSYYFFKNEEGGKKKKKTHSLPTKNARIEIGDLDPNDRIEIKSIKKP